MCSFVVCSVVHLLFCCWRATPRAGDTPVRSHPLAAVAAVARRRAVLRPTGLELFFLGPQDAAAAAASDPGAPVCVAVRFEALSCDDRLSL